MTIPQPRRVLYIDEDNKAMAIKRRLKYFPERLGRKAAEWDGVLHYWYSNNLTLGKPWKVPDDQPFIKPELIIIDSLYCYANIDLNNQKECALAKAQFRYMQSQNNNCAILIIHHPRKTPSGTPRGNRTPEDISGSGVLSAMADTIWMMSKKNDVFTVSNVKLRADPEAGKLGEVRLKISDYKVSVV